MSTEDMQATDELESRKQECQESLNDVETGVEPDMTAINRVYR